MRIRVGTRGSRLALAQTRWVEARLRARGHEVEEVVILTEGDRDQESTFAQIGAVGVFVRDIERALLDETIDVAVHSYKDLPSVSPEALVVGAVPERLDPADHLLVRREAWWAEGDRLPVREGARVGTSSARRHALLHWARPDLELLPLRGNVDTRVRKLVTGQYDAIVLAGAGLRRLREVEEPDGSLGEAMHDVRLDPSWFVPAPAQGALALQVRRSDDRIGAVVDEIHQPETGRQIACERRLLARVEGSCQLPFGAWCRSLVSGGYALAFAMGQGTRLVCESLEGDEPLLLADRAWDWLAREGLAVR